jgi:hypothetical protein
MAYRGDDALAELALEAPTAAGPLRLEVAPRRVSVSAGARTLHVHGKFATLVEARKKQESIRLEGRLYVARDPRGDLGIWLELDGRAMRRIFGVEPASLMEPEGLAALQRLDAVAQRLRVALADQHGGELRRAVEIGRGLDKILLADHGDHHAIYSRRLFRDRARFTLAIHDDGRIVIPGEDAFRVRSKFGITVLGDYIRFADADGVDLGRVAVPWLSVEDREDLAHRIGQLVHEG